MSDKERITRPPRIASWLIGLFVPEARHTILGDLHDEFFSIAHHRGFSVASDWYWRQVLKSIAHLYWSGVSSSAWSISFLALAAIAFPRLVGALPEKGLFAVLRHFHLYQRDFRLYMFFATDGVAFLHIITTFFIGCVVALLAKGKEMAVTTTIALLSFSMFLLASVWLAASHSQIVWAMLPWNLADWLAMLIGGAMVRSRRSRSIARTFS